MFEKKSEFEKVVAQKQLARSLDYKKAFNTDEGKRVFKDLMGFCHFLSPSVPSDGNPHNTAFNEGKRQVFLRILQFIEQDIDSMRTYIREVNTQED